MILSFFNRGGASRDPGEEAARAQAATRLRLIRDYWTALCGRGEGGTSLPRRSDISPRGIDGALSQAFLIERVAPGIARLRIAGMDLNDLMGMDVRGMPFSCLLEPAARNGFGRMLEQVLSGQAVLEAELEAERDGFRPALRAQLMILPLAVEPDGRRMAFGGLAMIGQIGKAPRRFHVARHHLIPEGLPQGEGTPPAHQPAFAESAVPFEPLRRSPAEKPYLRLVK
jgi:hypothetical protein